LALLLGDNLTNLSQVLEEHPGVYLNEQVRLEVCHGQERQEGEMFVEL
jgi:hypothetical protein